MTTPPVPTRPTDEPRPPAARAPRRDAPATSSALPRCRLAGSMLEVAPFRIVRGTQAYLSATRHAIDLADVVPGRYRVVAVHNFHVEDRNPDLAECVAGIFLAARRDDGAWEEPERFPVECRALAVLGVIEIGVAGRAPHWVDA